jgi:2,3-bisphosphoglycerate-dependent phosphoglycerate mutase
VSDGASRGPVSRGPVSRGPVSRGPAFRRPERLRVSEEPPGAATRVVLVRHGEANCNVNGVIGGQKGDTGLTANGVAQVAALRDRLLRTGELGSVEALYASTLPRAVQTAEILAPALDRWREGPSLSVVEEAGLSELMPGEADGMTWAEFAAHYAEPDWDNEPGEPLAPGGESWDEFVDRATGQVAKITRAHPGGLVVLCTHAGVIESTMLRYFPVGPNVVRIGLRTEHASLSEWEIAGREWTLRRYNDVARFEREDPPPGSGQVR